MSQIRRAAALMCACTVFLFCFASTAEAKHPRVIFIPGLMGSQLELADPQHQGTIVWGTALGRFWNFDDLEFPRADRRDKKIRSTAVLTELPAFHLLFSILTLDPAYGPFLKHFEALFSKLPDAASSHMAFHYDWRQSNVESACQLKEWLEAPEHQDWAQAAKTDGLILVGHSMGGIVARLFIAFNAPAGTLPSDANPCPHQFKVVRFVSVATPFFGAGKALRRLMDITDEEQKFLKLAGNSKPKYWKVFYSLPSVYELMPSYADCCKFSDAAGSRTVDVLDAKTWFDPSLKIFPPEFVPDPGFQAWLTKRLEQAKEIRQIVTVAPQGVDTLNLSGSGEATVANVVFRPGGAREWVTACAGDGTVPANSGQRAGAGHLSFGSAKDDHMGLLEDPLLLKILDDAMTRDDISFGGLMPGANGSAQQPSCGK